VFVYITNVYAQGEAEAGGVYMSVGVYVYMVYVCVRISGGVYAETEKEAHTYIHTYNRSSESTHTQEDTSIADISHIHTYINTYMHTGPLNPRTHKRTLPSRTSQSTTTSRKRKKRTRKRSPKRREPPRNLAGKRTTKSAVTPRKGT
jgi:hypothetical protein